MGLRLELAWLDIEPRPRVEAALLWAAVESADSTSSLQYSHPSAQWMDVRTVRPFVFLSPSASETRSRWMSPGVEVSRPGVEGVELLSRDRGVEACRGLSRGLSRPVARPVEACREACRGLSRGLSRPVARPVEACREACRGLSRGLSKLGDTPLVRLDLFESLPSRRFGCRASTTNSTTKSRSTSLYNGGSSSRSRCRALQLYSAPERSTSLQLYSALHSTSSTPSLRLDTNERGVGGRWTDDDDTHKRHTDTNKLTRHTASGPATHPE